VAAQTRHRLLLGALAIALLGGAAIFLLRQFPLVSDQPPGAIETAMARRVVVLSIPRSTRDQRNPFAADTAAWRAGLNDFQEHCAFCHGRGGRGDSGISKHVYPPVPDLADPAIQGMSDGALFAVVSNGVRWTGMPAFRQDHKVDDIWRLIAFVRRVPSLTDEDFAPPPDASPIPAGAGVRTIAMDGTAFTPAQATVAVGDTVTWVNNDPFPHNVASARLPIHSGDMQPGQRWTFRPTAAGRFDYECTLHPGMRGTLIVEQTHHPKEQ